MSHAVAQMVALSHRLYMKAVICTMTVSAEFVLWMKIKNNVIVTVTTRRMN